MKKYMYCKGIATAFLMTAALPALPAGDAKEKDFMWYCTSDEATEQQKYTVQEMMRGADLDPETTDCQTAFNKINKLGYISINFKPIEDASPASGLDNVKSLFARGTSFTNMDGVTGLPNLVQLRLDRSLMAEFPDFTRFPKFERVSFYSSNISSLDRVGTAPNLKYLGLTGTNVSDFSPLSKAESLKALLVDELANPAALGTLPSVPRLMYISVNGNGLTSLERFKSLPKLSGITAIGNSIDSLDGLEGLEELTSLKLAENKIRKLKNREVLKKIAEIDVSHNPLEDFSFISLLREDLGVVDLSYTDFDDIPAFYRYREHLTRLALNGTRISEIPADFGDWPSLETLELMDTSITSFAAFKGIQAPNLTKFEGPMLKKATEENCPTVDVPEGVKTYCKLQIDSANKN